MTNEQERWRCEQCGKISTTEELECYPHPAGADYDEVYACPQCKNIGDFEALCWHPECTRKWAEGHQHKDLVYRFSCGLEAHREKQA